MLLCFVTRKRKKEEREREKCPSTVLIVAEVVTCNINNGKAARLTDIRVCCLAVLLARNTIFSTPDPAPQSPLCELISMSEFEKAFITCCSLFVEGACLRLAICMIYDSNIIL